MANPYINARKVSYAPTDTVDLYPDTDGEPMAASDYHLEILMWLLLALRAHFAETQDTYVSGDILTYYTEGNPRHVVAPDVLVSFGIGQKPRPHLQSLGRGEGPRLRHGVLKQDHLSKRSHGQDGTLRHARHPELYPL